MTGKCRYNRTHRILSSSLLSLEGEEACSLTARNFLTRPPTGTPRRATSPSEALPILCTSLRGVATAALYCAHRTSTVLSLRVLRARRAPGRSLSILLRARVARARGAASLAFLFPCPLLASYGIMPPSWRRSMEHLLEYAGSVHIYLGPYRGNPISLYLKRTETGCQISPKVYPWNEVVGSGETPNKAAADFEEKWKRKVSRRICIPVPRGKEASSRRNLLLPERPAAPKPAAPTGASAPDGQSSGPASSPSTPADATPAPAPALAAHPAAKSS